MSSINQSPSEPTFTPAEQQFNTSSLRPVPAGYEPWKIRNDYPPPKPSFEPAHHGDNDEHGDEQPFDAPWLQIPLTEDPRTYMEIVKEYCFEGMTEHEFVPQKNTVRDWYHAPWMHYGPAGREPLHGLTSERYCPPRELSATQHRTTQTWAVGFFNSTGASVFGGMWANPNEPNWEKDIKFPLGTAMFKMLWTNATNVELPNMIGAPVWEAMIALQSPKINPNPNNRVSSPQPVRLLQMDIATRDDRSETGWVFGTFMYNGLNGEGKKGYEGMMPVGLQWGNDPELTQERYEKGEKPEQVWINPEADAVRVGLHGGRPGWGWNGRLNGPADNFISACQSCHSTAQWNHRMNGQGAHMTPPAPVQNAYGQFIPNNDKITMTWFSNIPGGTPIAKGDEFVSADYSLQLMIGYENFKEWESKERHQDAPGPVRSPMHRRQGPNMDL